MTAMGVKGAAYATVIGQFAAFLLTFIFHKEFNKHISGSMRGFRPDVTIIKLIYLIGYPAIFGLRDASMLIISFTYGTKNKQRLKESIRYLLQYTLTIMLIGTILFEIFAIPMASAFGLSGETMQLCIWAIRIVSLSFVFAGFNVACQAIFQAIDSGMKSLVISFARRIIFVLPVAYAFTRLVIMKFDYAWTVWLTFVIAETITAAIAVVLLKRVYIKKMK